MNSENGKTSDSHRVNLLGKTTLKSSDKCLTLSNLSIYYKWKNIKKSSKIKKFKISPRAWNDKLKLPDGSYSASNIQDCVEYIKKNRRN